MYQELEVVEREQLNIFLQFSVTNSICSASISTEKLICFNMSKCATHFSKNNSCFTVFVGVNYTMKGNILLQVANSSLAFCFIQLHHKGTGSPQQHMPITVASYCLTLSTFPVGEKRSTQKKPTTFDRVLTYTLHMRTGFKSHLRSSYDN